MAPCRLAVNQVPTVIASHTTPCTGTLRAETMALRSYTRTLQSFRIPEWDPFKAAAQAAHDMLMTTSISI